MKELIDEINKLEPEKQKVFKNIVNRIMAIGFNIPDNKLIDSYKMHCNQIALVFAEKHDLKFDSDNWVGNQYGIISLGDYFVNIELMILDVEYEAPKNVFFDWHKNKCNNNYYSWLMMLRSSN